MADTDAVRAFSHMEALTALGPRVSGSAAERSGIAYIAERFARAGLAVETPSFPIRRWIEKDIRLSAGGRPVQARGVPFSGTLAAGEHCFPVAAVESGAPFDLGRASRLEGAAWLLLRDAYIHYPDTALVRSVAPHRPGLLVFTASPGHVGGVPTVFYNFRDMDACPAPPCLVISHDDMSALVAADVTELTVAVDAEVVAGRSANVVGELAGSDRAEEIVVVCAHHDSAPTSPGACDNAGGSAVVLELATALAGAGSLRRTVHFAVWGSHETGMHGSEDYIRQARRAGRNVVAAINLDTIGQTIGQDRLSILGGDGWNRFIDGIAGESGIDPSIHRGPGYTDYTNFGAAGVPAVSIAQCHVNWNHTPGDSLDRCSPRALVKPLALASRLLERIADADSDFRPDFAPDHAAEVARFNGRWGWSNFEPFVEKGDG